MSLHVVCIMDSTCAAESDGFTEMISAATPAAYGEEKEVQSISE